MPRQTTISKPNEIDPAWVHVDASGQILGRLSSQIAVRLMGKHLPSYTPHVLCGDYVIVTNAQNIIMTGRKAEKKMQTRYTGYPGGLKMESYGEIRDKHPERLIENAVRRMLPKNKLASQMLSRLKVYAGESHPHEAQNPLPMEIKS